MLELFRDRKKTSWSTRESILKRFSAANLAMFYSFCLRDFFHKLLFALYIVAKMTFTSVCVSGRGEKP